MLRLRDMIIHEDERGYTLPETLVTIVILGILVVIGIIIFLNILERRRVEQSAGDGERQAGGDQGPELLTGCVELSAYK